MQLEANVLSVLRGLQGDFEHVFVKLVMKRERMKIIFQLRDTNGKAMGQSIAPADQPNEVEQAFQTAMVLSWIAAAGASKETLRHAKTLITSNFAD